MRSLEVALIFAFAIVAVCSSSLEYEPESELNEGLPLSPKFFCRPGNDRLCDLLCRKKIFASYNGGYCNERYRCVCFRNTTTTSTTTSTTTPTTTTGSSTEPSTQTPTGTSTQPSTTTSTTTPTTTTGSSTSSSTQAPTSTSTQVPTSTSTQAPTSTTSNN